MKTVRRTNHHRKSRTGRLLGTVLGETGFLDLFGFLVDLVIGAEEIQFIFIFFLGGSSSSGRARGRTVLGSGFLFTGESGLLLGGVRGNVLEPSGSVRELDSLGSLANGLDHGDIGLRGDESTWVAGRRRGKQERERRERTRIST